MRISFALAIGLVSASAHAGQICTTVSFPSTHVNWNQTLSIPRFDPALGNLSQVSVSISTTMTGSMGVEDPDPTPSQVTSTMSLDCTVHRPDNSTFVSVSPAISFIDNFTAYDGTIDFRGTSGTMHTGISVPASITGNGNGGDLALFSGPSGNPGSISLPYTATGTSVSVGPGTIINQFQVFADAIVTVCYDYTPAGASFCAGDGSATACPCGNASAVGAGQGCLNSTGSGARLTETGTPSVSNDTLVLSCNGLPASTSVLFFQGTLQQSGGSGSLFGDGLRCVTGTVLRLHTVVASSGVATWPQGGGSSISTMGSVPANSVRHYQAWYRNAMPFCTSSTFNLSQGLSVSWQP